MTKSFFSAIIVLVGLTTNASGGSLNFTKPEPTHELWLNAGFLSHHFQTDKGLNNDNHGIGAEYRYTSTSAVTLGQFYNSDRQTSHYAGWYWQPLRLGAVRFGAVVGGFDGYPKMNNGGWFLSAIPVASVEFKRIGMNIAVVPTLKNKLYGAVSFQLKLKLY